MTYKDSTSLKPELPPTPEVLRETAARVGVANLPPPRSPYVPKLAVSPVEPPPVDLGEMERVMRSTLALLGAQLMALTFHEMMQLCAEITEQEGYKPPTQAHELAVLLNGWAQAHGKGS
jgi:hypothetical protein